MFVVNKNENTLKEIFCAYFINKGLSRRAITPVRTNSREIGFQLTKRTFDIDALIGAIDKDQITNGKVCFLIWK